ncbi:hypothetical protein YK56LOC_31700 [Caballeronia sp. HLA56]
MPWKSWSSTTTDLAQSLADLITKMGHQAAVAHDCESARALAQSRSFDIILADVDLPDGDGREVCEGLRMTGTSQEAVMIAVTGRVDLNDNDFPAFDGYMRKPLTYGPFERALEEWRVALGLSKNADPVNT